MSNILSRMHLRLQHIHTYSIVHVYFFSSKLYSVSAQIFDCRFLIGRQAHEVMKGTSTSLLLSVTFVLILGSERLHSYAICRMKATSKLAWMMYIISYFNFRARENNTSILLSPRLVHDDYSTTAFPT